MRGMYRAMCVFPGLLALVVCCPAMGQNLVPVRLTIDGKPVQTAIAARTDGRQVLVPLEVLRALKCTFVLSKREDSAEITSSQGVCREVALTRVSGALMMILDDVVGLFDGSYTLQKDACDIRTTPAQTARTPKNEPKPPTAERAPTPTGSQPKTVETREPSSTGQPAKSEPAATPKQEPRANETAAREASRPHQASSEVSAPPRAGASGQGVQSADTLEGAGTPAGAGVGDVRGDLPSRAGDIGRVPATPPKVREVVCEAVDPAQARLRILGEGNFTPRVTMGKNASEMVIDLPGAVLETAEKSWAFGNPLIAGVEAVADAVPGVTRLLVRFSRLVTYKVRPTPPDGFEISLRLPRLTGRRLQEITVVIDPGHGGPSATGCSAVHNGVRIYEKDLTLKLGRKVYERLRALGLNVMLTRTDDRAVSLAARPELANVNMADLFVSIHVDFVSNNPSASGTTAYFHGSHEEGRALAYALSQSVSSAGGLPNRGARSDMTRFASGMAVLRRAEMPAVLLEVAYLSNPQDRAKLVQEEFQNRIADAIVAGIRAYVEARIPLSEPAGEEN